MHDFLPEGITLVKHLWSLSLTEQLNKCLNSVYSVYLKQKCTNSSKCKDFVVSIAYIPTPHIVEGAGSMENYSSSKIPPHCDAYMARV